MATILCYDREGNAVPVSSDTLSFRPAVYGVFIENNQVFLLKHPTNGLWSLPGKVLAEDEPPTQAIRQLFRKLTGLVLHLGSLIYVEDQYVVDDDEKAWHQSLMYYLLTRPSITTTPTLTVTDHYEQPEWVSLTNLQRHELQFGYQALQAARLLQKI